MFYRDTDRTPFALLSASDVDFFPGLVLFETLTAQTSASVQSA